MTVYFYYKNHDDIEPTPITLETIKDRLSDIEIIEFIGLAIALRDSVLNDDGENRAIAIRRIESLEDKLYEFSYAISSL